jgi:hypothetical protein
VLPRWPWARRLRLSVVRTNDQVLGFWRRMGFPETGEVRPWRYDTLESESILVDKRLPPLDEGQPPARRRSRAPWRSGGRGSVRSTRVPSAGWVKARRQAWRKGRGTPRRAARVGSAP